MGTEEDVTFLWGNEIRLMVRIKKVWQKRWHKASLKDKSITILILVLNNMHKACYKDS